MAVVAERAGVHTTTVSLALRNHPSLPLATRQRLQALAVEMGYQRDPALSALVAYRRQSRPLKNNPLLAYVTNWSSRWGWKDHPAHHAFFTGAQEKAASLGYQVEHFWLGEEGMSHRRMSRILYSRGITGIVLASHQYENDAPIDFEWSKFSAVKIDFSPRAQHLHMVTNDQRTIVALAMQRMMAAGYKRVGFVMPRWWDNYVERAWSAGFLAEQQLVAPADQVPILYFSSPENSNGDFRVPREPLSTWLRAHKPEVILSYGPFVKPTLAELGLSIPKDIAFVDTFLETEDGSTAGVRQNCHRVGELSIEVLAGQLNQHIVGIPTIPTATLVEGAWCDGASLPPRKISTPAKFTEAAKYATFDGKPSQYFSRTRKVAV